MKKTKVLFLTPVLKNYRVPILNTVVRLSDIDLTVAHGGKSIVDNNDKISEIIIKSNSNFGFTFVKDDFDKMCKEYDVIVVMLYLRNISFLKLALKRNKRYKLIFWTIGVRASQKNKFDSPSVFNLLRHYFVAKSDATIFYTDYAKDKYLKRGIDDKKLFVMQNTVAVGNTIEEAVDKNSLLFIGTLNKSKKIFELLNAYKLAIIERSLPILNIIGNGEDFEEVVNWVRMEKLNDNIIIHGPIFNESELEYYFKQSIVTISPGQAGLSVLKSFGYGVPFITKIDAITGGERLNIKDQVNGVLYSDENQLKNILIDVVDNEDKYLEMGRNALSYYEKERSPSIMAQGFINAVNFVKNK